MIGLLCVGVLQLLLVTALLADPSRLLDAPIRSLDYAAHFYNGVHAADHLRDSGRLWGYDPYWMAGYPNGVVGLLDDKLFSTLVLLAPIGWKPLVFNGAIVFILISVPWLIGATAHAAGRDPAEVCGAALAAVVATFSVPACVLFWSWGGLSFFFASALAVPVGLALATTLSHESLASPRALGAAIAGMIAVYTHPAALLILGPTLLPLVWCGPRPLAARLRDLVVLGALLGVTLLPIVEALAWLRAPLRTAHPAHELFRGGLAQLRRDWGTDLFDTSSRRDGAGGLLILLPLAAWGIFAGDPARSSKSRRRDVADQVLLVALLFCASIAYLSSSLSERAVPTQPYRFLIPMSFFACVVAGTAIARVGRSLTRRSAAAWLLGAAAILVIANAERGLWPILVLGHGEDPAESDVARFVRDHTTDEDRVLVESTTVPLWVDGRHRRAILSARFALLPTLVRREFIGYSGVEPFTAHRYARFDGESLLGENFGTLSEDRFRTLLARYAISWVVGCRRATLEVLGSFAAVIEPVASAADCRIFRVRAPERSRFAEGTGRVSADYDRIAVNGAVGDRVVLKYHWMPGLRTEPPLAIEEAHEPGMPVGFIAVRTGGTHDFVIVPTSLSETAALGLRRLRSAVGLAAGR